MSEHLSPDGSQMERMANQQERWEKVSAEVETVTDGLGKKIERGIKPAIVGLNALEINTYQSCEGHASDRKGYILPWVGIEASNAPEKFYEDAPEVTRELCAQYGIGDELFEKYQQANQDYAATLQESDVPTTEGEARKTRDAFYQEYSFSKEDIAKFEGMSAIVKPQPTLEYLEWREKNKELWVKVNDLLGAFYKTRSVPEDVKIRLTENYDNVFRIYNGLEDNEPRLVKKSTKEKEVYRRRLKNYRTEFKAFAGFLKNTFLKKLNL